MRTFEARFERQHSTEMPRHRNIHVNHNHIGNTLSELTPFVFACRSVACERHPNRNEDSIIVDKNTGLVAVFDGVGGSAAGEIASQTAARATLRTWRQAVGQLQKRRNTQALLEHYDAMSLCALIEQLILEADEHVRTEGAQRAGTDDLATTVALAVICREATTHNYKILYAHVGDSRVYLLREGEPLKRLTNDDGLLAKLVENKIVDDQDALRIDQAMHADQLSDTERSYFRLRGGITQALGGPLPPSIHVNQMNIRPGDRILLSTDGIHDNLTDEEIEHILRNAPRVSTARLLVEHSIHRSHQESNLTIRAKPDDMTAIVLTCRF